MPPVEINGETVNDVQVNGQSVDEVTANGQTVFSAIPDSAIHHWPMDEGSGQTLNDNVGNEDGTISGPTWISDSWEGGFALDADGTDDTVNFNNSILPSDNFTILITIESTDWTDNPRIIYDGVETHSLRADSQGSGSIGFSWNGNSTGDGTFRWDGVPDTRFRLAVVVNSGVVSFYNNGAEITKDAEHAHGFSNSNVSFFSRGGEDEYWDGVLDNAIICDSVLSGSEIQDDYENQPWS